MADADQRGKSYAMSATKCNAVNRLSHIGGHWQIENGEYGFLSLRIGIHGLTKACAFSCRRACDFFPKARWCFSYAYLSENSFMRCSSSSLQMSN